MKLNIFALLTALPICLAQAQTQARSYLDGQYAVNLKIGDHTFRDEMELKAVSGLISLEAFSGSIAGTMTVPGVFSVPLTGMAHCESQKSSCQVQFTIQAKEGGQTYNVHYRAELSGDNYTKAIGGQTPPVLTGSAFLDDGGVMGNFEAIKK